MTRIHVEIKIAEVDDAVPIALLGRVTFDETFGHLFRDRQDLLDYFENTFSVKKLKQSLAKDNNKFWIAYVNNLPVGYAKIKLQSSSSFIDSNQICQLQKIYVLRDFLGLKIGGVLLDRCIEEARSLNYESMWLSVLESNARAIGFYQKNGFEEVGEHDFTIGKEDFSFSVMALSL